MIGLDATVLVRYLAQDDPVQSAAASRVVEALTRETPGFISQGVLVELICVLEHCYGVGREPLGAIIEAVLKTDVFVVADAATAWQALRRFRAGAAHYLDHLASRNAVAAGCEFTWTLDPQAAGDNDEMRLLD